MIKQTPEVKITAAAGVECACPERRLPTAESLPPASRFQNELDVVARSATNNETLFMLVVQALQRFNRIVGGAILKADGTRVTLEFARLEHPALQHPSVLEEIRQVSRLAAETPRDVVCTSRIVPNLGIVAVPLSGLPGQFALTTLVADPNAERLNEETQAARSAARCVTECLQLRTLRNAEIELTTTAALVELCGRIEASATPAKAARIIADSLKDDLPASVVAVGLCAKGRRTVRIEAVTGIANFDRSSARARKVTAALNEAIVRESATHCLANDPQADSRLLAHRQLLKGETHEVVLSSPLTDSDGSPVGAVLLCGPQTLASAAATGMVNTLEKPVGGAIAVVRRAKQGLLRRAIGSMFAADSKVRTLAVLACLIVAASVLLIPVPYRIASRFTVAATEVRFCVVPFDGMLQQTFAKPGDVVEQGQTLALMDDAEHRYELSGLLADHQRARQERDVHLADRRVADSYMSALESDRITSRRQVIEQRLASLKLQSPIAGVVLEGGSERRENFPVESGHAIYEIAPLDRVRLDLQVPADEISHVEVGMTVEFRTADEATRLHKGTISRIRPRSEILNNRNVFVAEVDFDNANKMLQPGMDGSARIVSDAHPLGWNLFHRAWEHVATEWLW